LCLNDTESFFCATQLKTFLNPIFGRKLAGQETVHQSKASNCFAAAAELKKQQVGQVGFIVCSPFREVLQ